MTFPYGSLGSASSLLGGGGLRGEGRENQEPALAQQHRTRRGGRRMDVPRDFIVLSEFSEQVGPVPVVGVLQGMPPN